MSQYFLGDVVCNSDDGEIFLSGWLGREAAIKYIEDFFDSAVDNSDIREVEFIYMKYVPCRHNPDGYPGLYYPCNAKTRGAMKCTRVTLI